MPRIFISYRREDSKAESRLIDTKLRKEFGDANVFLDTTTLKSGTIWSAEIQSAIIASDIVIVVIGNKWDDKNNLIRLHDPADTLRREIETAINHRKRIIPVLVDDRSKMPDGSQLPPSLFILTSIQNFVIPDNPMYFDQGVNILIKAIKGDTPRGRKKLLFFLAIGLIVLALIGLNVLQNTNGIIPTTSSLTLTAASAVETTSQVTVGDYRTSEVATHNAVLTQQSMQNSSQLLLTSTMPTAATGGNE